MQVKLVDFLVGQWLRIFLPMQGTLGFNPWFGVILQATRQLEPPRGWEVCNKKSRCN